MMTHEELKGIVKTITDGIKDANMQIEYAETARASGNHDLAMLHASEAKKRLEGVKEWYEKAKTMHHEEKHSPLEEIFICHYKHWYHDIHEKVEEFHKR
jgi:uncharacterized protein with ACT and thioredoxin-like domain